MDPQATLLAIAVVLIVAFGGTLAYYLRRYRRGDVGAEYASFSARPAARDRRRLLAGAGLFLLAGAIAILVSLDRANQYVTLGTVMLVVAGVLLAGIYLYQEQDVVVTDAGLRIQGTLHRWSTIEQATFGADALVIERAGWRTAFRYDRSDIENEADVRAALDRFVSVSR